MPWLAEDLERFAEKYKLAREIAIAEFGERGTSGLELEWNVVDSDLRPLGVVRRGAGERSFADAFRSEFVPEWLVDRTQLEVFHWMVEWTTRPHYSPILTIYEGRLLEALFLNALAKAGRALGIRLYALPGNLLRAVTVGHDSIPSGWNSAKRRYLESCVDLFGRNLATAGIHTNLSLPEPLLAWDFMQVPPHERGEEHLDDYRNRVYVESARLLRAFASLFIATSASTPLEPRLGERGPQVILTSCDSVRTLTFPCPEAIDPADLYRSHPDYLRISRDLVRRGIRFGNNNWTPLRARSSTEPVERLIAISSKQLDDLWRLGKAGNGQTASREEMAQAIVLQNLLARIDLPMARVEIRTDEGSHPLSLDIANLTLRELLLIRTYGDRSFARAFRYDAEDVARARQNEHLSATRGMLAEIEDPFSGKLLGMRDFLRRTLQEVAPLAEGLGYLPLLTPLQDMAEGAPNTAERLRGELEDVLGETDAVPVSVLRKLAERREQEVALDIELIGKQLPLLGVEAQKLRDLLDRAREEDQREPGTPIRFGLSAGSLIEVSYPDKVTEILDLAQQLIRIESVSCAAPGGVRLDEICRVATWVFDYLQGAGLQVRTFEKGDYPAILAGFPGQELAPIMLSGHFDVVEADRASSQFQPRIEGDYLWGRGACDMKTVLATFLVWMKDMKRDGAPYPAINLLLVGNEEIGETEPEGTPHVLAELWRGGHYAPELVVAGERTGEHGDERVGEVCIQGRGLVRLTLTAHGIRGHTGIRGSSIDLSERLLRAQ